MNPPTILFSSVNRWRTQDNCVGGPGMSSGGSNQVRRPTAYVVSGSNYGSSGGKSFFVVCHPVHFSSKRAFIMGLVLQFQAKSATAQSIYQERGGTCSCDAVAAAMIIWSPRGRGNKHSWGKPPPLPFRRCLSNILRHAALQLFSLP